MSRIKQFLKQLGIYMFFVSLLLFTQLNWIKKHDRFNGIEIRLFLAFFLGTLLSFGVISIVKKIAKKYTKKYEALLDNISIAVSPGILFIFASLNSIFLIIGFTLCILFALYIWVRPFREFIKMIVYIDKFKNILILKDNKAIIEITGMYEMANPRTLQAFLIDLVINFYECTEMKIEEIKVDFSKLKDRHENELKPIIESIARYFNLRITY